MGLEVGLDDHQQGGEGPAAALAFGGASLQPASTQAAIAASPASGISINQLIINQQPGEDAADLADKFLRELDQRRRLSPREALYDDL